MYLKCIVCGVFSHELVRKTSSSVSVLPTLSWALTLRVRSFTKLATGRSNGVGPAQKQVHATYKQHSSILYYCIHTTQRV